MPKIITTSESAKRKKTAPIQRNKKRVRLTKNKAVVKSSDVDDFETEITSHDENIEPGLTTNQPEAVSSNRPKHRLFFHENAETRVWSNENKEVFRHFFNNGMKSSKCDPSMLEECAQKTGKTVDQVKVKKLCKQLNLLFISCK